MSFLFFKSTKKQSKVLKRKIQEGDFSYILKALMFQLRISRFFTFTRGLYKMKVFYTPFAFWLWTNEIRKRADEAFFETFLREGDVVIDAGTNIGIITLTSLHKTGKTGRVYSIEPHPRTFAQMKENVALNNMGNSITFNCAVGEKDAEVFFTDEYVSDINHVSEGGSITVNVKPIDSLIPEREKVTILKLDVEGYELFGLRGARRVLRNTEVVYFESSPSNFLKYDYSLQDILVFLKENGFGIYSQEEDFSLKEISLDYLTTKKYENLLGVKNVSFYNSRIV